MVSANEGWAVGNFIPGPAFPATLGGPVVLHYTVTGGVGNWNVVTIGGLVGTAGSLNSVFMLSPTSGWAVGGYFPLTPFLVNPRGPIIVYWDGSKWTPVATPTIPGGPDENPPVLRSAYFTGPNDGWAVGNATILPTRQIVSTIFHWDGIAWTHITLAPALLGLAPDLIRPPILNSVYMTSPSNGWIVGGRPRLTNLEDPPPPNFAFPLSTILRFSPFGGLLAATSTTTYTVVSTVSTQTTEIVTSSTSTSISTLTSSTTTTTTSTASVAGGGIPGFPVESIVAGLLVGVMMLIVLRRKRTTSQTG